MTPLNASGASFTAATWQSSRVTIEHAKEGERRHPVAADGLPAALLTRLDGVRILVVDDEPDTNEVLQELFASCGAEVRVAASTRQALEILDRWRPTLIVSDIGMPEQDGYALIRQVREREPQRGGETPAVALTAYSRVEPGEDTYGRISDARREARGPDRARSRRRKHCSLAH